MIEDILLEGIFEEASENPEGIKEYLGQFTFEKNYQVSESGVINFHWANWDETCKLQRKSLKTAEGKKKLKKLESIMKVLSEIEIWIQNRGDCTRLSLFDLYEAYLDPRLRMMWFEEQEKALVSLHHQAGPYVPVRSMRWFNKDIYALFIYRKLLLEDIPMRSFRLGVNIPLRCFFDGSPLVTAQMSLHQLTDNGVVLKLEGGHIPLKISMSEHMEMHLDLSPFKMGTSKNVQALLERVSLYPFEAPTAKGDSFFKVSSNIISKYGNSKNIRNCNEQEAFLYIPYSEMIEGGNKTIGPLKNTVDIFKNHFQKELKKAA